LLKTSLKTHFFQSFNFGEIWLRAHLNSPDILIIIIIINNLTFILRLKHAMQTQRCRSLHIGKHPWPASWGMLQRHPSCYAGTILNSHRVIGIATNTSMVLNCLSDLHNDDSICRTAGCRLNYCNEITCVKITFVNLNLKFSYCHDLAQVIVLCTRLWHAK